MKGVIAAAKLLSALNHYALAMGRAIGIVAVAFMVIAILVQVFFRYVLNNALPWPDEAARFCMLWMTALMAPTALRTGGFVAIDSIDVLLPKAVSAILSVSLLFISLLVLIVAVTIGYGEVTGIGGRFATASLYVPLSPGLDEWYRIPRSWMMLSLLTGIVLLISVNVELILSKCAQLAGPEYHLPAIAPSRPTGGE